MSCLIFSSDKLVLNSSKNPFYGNTLGSSHFDVKVTTKKFTASSAGTWTTSESSPASQNVYVPVFSLADVKASSSAYYKPGSKYSYGLLEQYAIIDGKGNFISFFINKVSVPVAEPANAYNGRDWTAQYFTYNTISSGTSIDWSTDFTKYRGYVELKNFSVTTPTAFDCDKTFDDDYYGGRFLIRYNGPNLMSIPFSAIYELIATSLNNGYDGNIPLIDRISYFMQGNSGVTPNSFNGIQFQRRYLKVTKGRVEPGPSGRGIFVNPDGSDSTTATIAQIPVIHVYNNHDDTLNGYTGKVSWVSSLSYDESNHKITGTLLTGNVSEGLLKETPTSVSKDFHTAVVDQKNQPENTMRMGNCLVYKKENNKLCFSKTTGRPIVSKENVVDDGTWIKIVISWASPCQDLDICAYWMYGSTSVSDSQRVGWSYSRTAQQTLGYANLETWWSGDNVGTGGSETVRIRQTSAANNRYYTFRINLNYYGDGEGCNNKCNVVATWTNRNGVQQSLTRNDVSCSSKHSDPAKTSSSYVQFTVMKYANGRYSVT